MSDNKAVDGAIVDNPAPAGDDSPPLLGLPPPRAPAAGAGGRAGQSLDLSSGEARVELAHLGPMLLNDDGSVSRIANWQQMTAKEQEVAARRVAERNERRRAQLLAVEEREKLARQVDEAAQLGLESIQRFAGDLD